MIQIDMQMPKNCADCCFASAELINGTITLFCMTPVGRKMYAPDLISRTTKPEWCPLKEQEAVKPILEQGFMVCGECGHDVIVQRLIDGEVFDEKVSYCPACGRKAKWE